MTPDSHRAKDVRKRGDPATNRQLNLHPYESHQQNIDHHRLDLPRCGCIILLQTLFFKFTAAPESVFIFTRVGLEPWGRIGSGIAELIAAILILVPRTTWVGAGLVLAIMLGAIFSHLIVLGVVIRDDSRAALMARTYLRRFASRRGEILARGKTLKLVETGNHAQGCIFRDGMHLNTETLERSIDEISQKLPDFFIGRYDIRYENEEDFKHGRNFQIVELNGATSEATSIYDARNSLFSAYRTLFRQWNLVFAIGARNRANGHAPTSLITLWRNWRQYSVAALSYPLAD